MVSVRTWNENRRRRYPKGTAWAPTGPGPGRFAPRVGAPSAPLAAAPSADGKPAPPAPRAARWVETPDGDWNRGGERAYTYDAALLRPALKPRPADDRVMADWVHYAFDPVEPLDRYGFVRGGLDFFAPDAREPERGVMWRGVSAAELRAIRQHGVILSNGNTVYAPTPAAAWVYATAFAPVNKRPRVGGDSSYLIKVRNPGAAPLRADDVLAVYEARAVVEEANGSRQTYLYRALDADALLGRPTPRQAAPADDPAALPAADDLAAGDWTHLVKAGISPTFFRVTTADGREWFVKQTLPGDDDKARAEEAAAVIGAAVGVNVLPVERRSLLDLDLAIDGGAGSDSARLARDMMQAHGDTILVSPWVEGQSAAEVRVPREEFKDVLSEALIFDFIIGNTDRHVGNWMVMHDAFGENAQILLIDHGYAFQADEYDLWANSLFPLNWDGWGISRDRLAEMVAAAERCREDVRVIAGSEATFDTWWMPLQDRLDHLEKAIRWHEAQGRDWIPFSNLFVHHQLNPLPLPFSTPPSPRRGGARQAAPERGAPKSGEPSPLFGPRQGPPTPPSAPNYRTLPVGEARVVGAGNLQPRRFGITARDLEEILPLPGFHSTLHVFGGDDAENELRWEIRPASQRTGLPTNRWDFDIMLYRNSDGTRDAVFDHLELPATPYTYGMGRQMIGRLLRVLQKRGFDRVELTANVSIGTYAWARMGFEMDDEDLARANELFPDWARAHKLPEPAHGWPTFGSALEIATYALRGVKVRAESIVNPDVRPGSRFEVGKAFLLDRGPYTLREWDGYLPLDRPLPAYFDDLDQRRPQTAKAWAHGAPRPICWAIHRRDETMPPDATDWPLWADLLEQEA